MAAEDDWPMVLEEIGLPVHQIDWEEEVDVPDNRLQRQRHEGGYEESLFVPSPDLADFICIFCQQIAKRPRRHSKGPGGDLCSVLFCLNCLRDYLNFNGRRSAECPLRCTYDIVRGANGTVCHLITSDWRRYTSLRLKCIHNPEEVISILQYDDHVNNCSNHPDFCEHCRQVIANHSACPSLQRKLDLLRQQVQQLQEQVQHTESERSSLVQQNELLTAQNSENQEIINNLRRELAVSRQDNERLRQQMTEANETASTLRQQISSSEAEQTVCNVTPSSLVIRGISNHSRTYQNHDQLIINVIVNDIEHQIADLNLDSTGADLRSRLTEVSGQDPGQLLIIRHTPVQNNLRLRQHQLGNRPVYMLSIGNRSLSSGRALQIGLFGLGPRL